MVASHSRVPALDKVPGMTAEIKARRHQVLDAIAGVEEVGLTPHDIAKQTGLPEKMVRHDLTALEDAGLVADIAGSSPKMFVLVEEEEGPSVPLPMDLHRRAPDQPVMASAPTRVPTLPSASPRPEPEYTPPPPRPSGSLRGDPHSNKGRRRMRRWEAVFAHHAGPMLRLFWSLTAARPTTDEKMAEIHKKTGLTLAVINACFDELAAREEGRQQQAHRQSGRSGGWGSF